MRLKQLLGVIFLTLFAGAMALAANPQLTNVNVTGQGHATTVLLHANGAFTHTEYRPVDNLLLVDLAGVTAGKLKDMAQAVNKPGVVSYRILAYAGANGSEVARVELTLTPGAMVNVTPVTGGLEVRVSENESAKTAPSAVEKPAVEKPAPAAVQAAEPEAHAASGRTVHVKHVAVLRGKGGMEVEI
ncbi:MAG TPA: hypothetical protein VII81_05850, partial [Terriglobales bacterium]